MKPQIQLSRIFHRGSDALKLQFARNAELTGIVKSIQGSKWSKTHCAWYVPERKDLREEVFKLFQGKAWVNYDALKKFEAVPLQQTEAKPERAAFELAAEVNAENRIVLNKLKDWMRSKRYSKNSIHAYLDCLEIFSRWSGNKAFHDLQAGDLLRFNNEYILKQHLSASYQSHFISAIKLLFNVCRFKSLSETDLVRPKKPKKLPSVLGKEEVKRLLDGCKNIKHRCMLSLIYSCGLRCGELLALRMENIDSARNLLIVKEAKGNKDRIVPLSKKTLALINEYNQIYKTSNYLFEGIKPGTQYDERSLQNVLKQAVMRAEINRPVTLHWLRHSYATHLLEAGTNLRYIQDILGHKSSRTTEIYTHVSTAGLQNVVSPFDTL